MNDKFEMVGTIATLEEAEELDIDYYAKLNWEESVKNAELLRKMVWSKEYLLPNERTIRVGKLKDERNEFE